MLLKEEEEGACKPVDYCINAKYKLVATLEYITVQSEWMEQASCDCAFFQASCISNCSHLGERKNVPQAWPKNVLIFGVF